MPYPPVNSSNCEFRLEQVLDDIAKVLRTARQDIIILYGPPYKNLDPRKNVATDLVQILSHSLNYHACSSVSPALASSQCSSCILADFTNN